MNPYLQPHGFLGTGASLLADITVLAYILLIVPGMILGFIFARRKLHRPHHKWTMTTITIVNWILIIFLMFAAYRFDVAPNFPAQPNNTRYLLPVVHALFGLPAQLLATYVIYRMFREDSQVAAAKKRGETQLSKYWFKSAKPVMRLTLSLWLVTATLGVISYLTRYNVIPAYALNARVVAPVATGEVGAPIETPELSAPVSPSEASATTEVIAPAATEEIRSSATPQPSVTRVIASATTEALSPVKTQEVSGATATPRPSATRTPRAPVATEEITPEATDVGA